MNWTEIAANLALLGVPPVSCAWAWRLWMRGSRTTEIPEWRRLATRIGLMALTVSVGLGAFAWIYWHRYPGQGSGPPEPTRIATLLGFGSAVFGIPLAVLARSWTRVSLMVCSAALLGFYFGMFLAP